MAETNLRVIASKPRHPGFAAASEMRQAAHDHGFRIDLQPMGNWLAFASTTAPGRIYLACPEDQGPFLLATDHAGIRLEFTAAGEKHDIAGPVAGTSAIQLADTDALHLAVSRAYRLARALPPAPLDTFRKRVASLPDTTDAERLVVERIGQQTFREALMQYWDGRCPLTGISDPAILRASHIIPWSKCRSDAERLDVHNGLLLSAHWDAAFDARIVTFDDDGSVLVAACLSAAARTALAIYTAPRLGGLTPGHRKRLQWHRSVDQRQAWQRLASR